MNTPRNSVAADLSIAGRKAAGRALRTRVGFRVLGAWRAPARRTDPIAVLKAADTGREPSLPTNRYGLLQSPFTFYRGAVAAASTPTPE